MLKLYKGKQNKTKQKNTSKTKTTYTIFQVAKMKKSIILLDYKIYAYSVLEIYDLNIETCCGGFTLTDCQTPIKPLSHFPRRAGQEDKIKMLVDQGKMGDCLPLTAVGKRDSA